MHRKAKNQSAYGADVQAVVAWRSRSKPGMPFIVGVIEGGVKFTGPMSYSIMAHKDIAFSPLKAQSNEE